MTEITLSIASIFHNISQIAKSQIEDKHEIFPSVHLPNISENENDGEIHQIIINIIQN